MNEPMVQTLWIGLAFLGALIALLIFLVLRHQKRQRDYLRLSMPSEAALIDEALDLIDTASTNLPFFNPLRKQLDRLSSSLIDYSHSDGHGGAQPLPQSFLEAMVELLEVAVSITTQRKSSLKRLALSDTAVASLKSELNSCELSVRGSIFPMSEHQEAAVAS